MPIFARQHYQAIAEELHIKQWNDQDQGLVVEIICSLCQMLLHDNPNFNREKFLKACGMEGE